MVLGTATDELKDETDEVLNMDVPVGSKVEEYLVMLHDVLFFREWV